VQRGDAARVRLDLTQAGAVEAPQARHAVRVPAPLELVEARQLGLVERDDHLAAALVRDLVALAVLVQLARALDAEPRLQRPGRVVDPGVHYAAVVAGLVTPDAVLLLEHAHAQ
jgi:hypothetical protein